MLFTVRRLKQFLKIALPTVVHLLKRHLEVFKKLANTVLEMFSYIILMQSM